MMFIRGLPQYFLKLPQEKWRALLLQLVLFVQQGALANLPALFTGRPFGDRTLVGLMKPVWTLGGTFRPFIAAFTIWTIIAGLVIMARASMVTHKKQGETDPTDGIMTGFVMMV